MTSDMTSHTTANRATPVADSPPAVHVSASDYSYDGFLVATFEKRSGAIRCVVEDGDGRLFIHNPAQLQLASEVEIDQIVGS